MIDELANILMCGGKLSLVLMCGGLLSLAIFIALMFCLKPPNVDPEPEAPLTLAATRFAELRKLGEQNRAIKARRRTLRAHRAHKKSSI